MRRYVTAVVIILVLLGAWCGTVVAQDGTDEIDPDSVVIDIHVDESGDAIWQIEYRMRLDGESERAAFDDLREDIESDPSAYESRYEERMERSAESASNATGREMSIDSVEVTAETVEIPEEYGLVVYRFEWSNFAAPDGDGFVIGDAIDGMFFDEETTLIIRWPAEWSHAAVSPTPTTERSSAVQWDGPMEFGSGEPRVTVSPPGLLAWPVGVVAAVILGVIVLVGAVSFLARQGRLSIPRSRDEGEDSSPGKDPSLLSNEEQVMQVISEHGGRMKQQAVAEELGWTAAKTSQVTRDLRDSGRLDGFRLGRENVLRLPDAEAEPPTDEP